jgi:hypothetical protein
MPNCDYYATPEDHGELLTWLFSEATCHVYELSSDFEKELKRFYSASEVLAQFERRYINGERWKSVDLQVYVIGASPPFSPRKVSLDPKSCGGATYRYAAEGWGLIQLYLERPTTGGLDSSHTNHFTQKRAEALATTMEARAEVAAWDFKAVTAFSSRLNRKIKALSVGKLGSRPVLSGALSVWQSGAPLLPYDNTSHSVVLRADA